MKNKTTEVKVFVTIKNPKDKLAGKVLADIEGLEDVEMASYISTEGEE